VKIVKRTTKQDNDLNFLAQKQKITHFFTLYWLFKCEIFYLLKMFEYFLLLQLKFGEKSQRKESNNVLFCKQATPSNLLEGSYGSMSYT
jgi:hypothetical protein